MGRVTKQTPKINRQTLLAPEKTTDEKKYRCIRCQNEYLDANEHFYRNAYSPLTFSNDGYIHICKECCNNLYEDLFKQYKSERLACIMLCYYLDYPFITAIFDSIRKGSRKFSFTSYLRRISLPQNRDKTFQYTIETGELGKSNEDVLEENEDRWKVSDAKNKKYVISSLGYDCFLDSNYSSADRKFLFNTLSAYLVDDVLNDPHRTQSAIRLVETLLQSSKLGTLINNELAKTSPADTLKTYIEAKDRLDKNINQLANDNGFSIKNGGKALQGSNTLTNIMKEMVDNNFEDVKVNVFDIKMSNAFKSISDISNKSILDQLNFQSDDYARMVATQRDMITKYETDLMAEQEKNRLLLIENAKMKQQIGDGDLA